MLSSPRAAQTLGFCSTKVATSQRGSRQIQRRLRHRILTGLPAQGASIIEVTIRPCPVAMTPQPGHPATGSQDSTSSTRLVGSFSTAVRWRLGKSRRRSHRQQRLSVSEQAHVELGIVEVLGVSRG